MIETIRIMLLLVISVFFMSMDGCAMSEKIEYVSPPEDLDGREIQFKYPVVYLVFKDEHLAKDFGYRYATYDGIKVERYIISEEEVERPYSIFKQYPKENIRPDMKFEVVGSYWVRKNPIDREFSGEFQNIVLKDENGFLSVFPLVSFRVDTNFIEQTRGQYRK